MSIPASAIVQINPGVIGGGGNPLALNGILLTSDLSLPLGTVQPFSTADDVADFFGGASDEAALAEIYFNGFDNKTQTPGTLFFASYNAAAAAGWVRGGSLASMTLTQLQALSGTLIITVGGTVRTMSSVNLSSATSFSNAAAILTAATWTNAIGGVISWDSVRHAFVYTATATGASSTVTQFSGTLAAGLKLTTATGAVLSQGAIAAVPGTFLDAVKTQTLNWAAFTTTWEPDLAGKQEFAAWVNGQNKRFAYIAWDTDANAIVANDTQSLGALLKASNSDATALISGDASVATTLGVTLASLVRDHAAFVLGSIASIDFNRTNGRITFAFKHQAGLNAAVESQTVGDILIANGYNFYGSYATANDEFVFLYPGNVSGVYLFLDELVNEIWINAQLQLALMSLLTTVTSIPYNLQGYALIDAACQDTITQALNFGAIRPNVPLSALQAAQVNNAAGTPIDTVLSSRGWYLQILPATAQVRALRGSPPISLWYMDGGSIQKVNLASIVVQ